MALDRPDIPFDSLTILNKAKALARLEDPQSETAFLSALELSKQDENRRHSPSTFVECYWGYVRYRKSTKSEMSSLIRDYEELVACLDWKLGWPLDKKEAVVRDCIDLILNASGEVHAANGASLLTKCVLVIASFPSNRDTSLLVLDVADGILKCAQDRLAVGQDALALRHVETALSWTESYLQAVPEDPIVPADLLMRVLKPTSKFPQYYARLERSSGTIANVLAKCPTNSGAKYGARKLADALKIGEF